MPDEHPHAATVYQQLCDNYRAIDDFRTKLLGLLPFATAAGVGILLNGAFDDKAGDNTGRFLGAVGTFGFLGTLGLFSYELHGIKKCGWLIETGRRLETTLGVEGPFRSRPHQVAGFIDEPFAASVIYPASLAAWAFLALAVTSPLAATIVAIAVFVVSCRVSLALIRAIEADIESNQPDETEPQGWRDLYRLFLPPARRERRRAAGERRAAQP
jgi:hypothetical protein